MAARRLRWSPWAELARHPDIWVHRCMLHEGRGWWCPDERVILLDVRLDRRTARCVLAHELGHALLGHTGAPPFGDVGWLARRQEAEADRWAAQRLLDAADVAAALAAHPDDAEQAALELDVTTAVLRTWLRCRPSRPSIRAG
ncbi:MAG TPA: ImmA/IrrE family metallo-endopeptidase [Actinomycetales bacterium]|nr:ImmA/IrrE family metallo-endopeptidase [Actinomycetales bacterium]